VTVTVGQVQASHPEQLTDAGARVGTTVSTVDGQIATQQQTIAALKSGWTGASADAALKSAQQTLAQQQRLRDALAQMQSALQNGGSRLTPLRTSIVQDVGQLGGLGFQVAQDGTVTVQPGSRLDQLAQSSPVTAMKIQQVAATDSAMMKKLLADYTTTDASVADSLRQATGRLDPAPQDTPGGGQPPADPKQPKPDDPAPAPAPAPDPPPPGADDPVPGPADKPGDPGYHVPHAPGDPADPQYGVPANWKTDAQGMANPPGYPPMPPGAQRDDNWRQYLGGKNGDGTQRPFGQPPPAYPLPEAVQDKGLKIIGAAENQQGTRYAWGGGNKDGTTKGTSDGGGTADKRGDLNHTGFDCSGLAEYSIYQATGHDPGHFSGTQFAEMTKGGDNSFGTVVQAAPTLDPANLRPGDIIYEDSAKTGVAGQHVKIYMGNGVTVETSESGTPAHSQTADLSTGSNLDLRVVRPR
jgi:peptidoglycan DL-endopeptidase RipA